MCCYTRTKKDKLYIFNIFSQINISLKYFNNKHSISIMSIWSYYSSQFLYVLFMIHERIIPIQTLFNWITKQKRAISNFLTFLTNQNGVKEFWRVIEEYVLIYFRKTQGNFVPDGNLNLLQKKLSICGSPLLQLDPDILVVRNFLASYHLW